MDSRSWSERKEPRFYRDGIPPCTGRIPGGASLLLVADSAALHSAFPALLILMVIGGIKAPAPSSGHTEHQIILPEWGQRFMLPASLAWIVAMAKLRMLTALGAT